MLGKVLLFTELLIAFTLLFWWMRKTSLIHNMYRRARRTLEKKTPLSDKLDTLLLYSGLHKKLPFLTAETWILLQLAAAGGICVAVPLLGGSLWIGILAMGGFLLLQYMVVSMLIARNYNSVDSNLLKFLDFLGNYSITSGEVTSVLYQISGYMEEPMRSVLQECYYETRTFGDAGGALLSMTRKLQHPKFGEIIRNIEITMRYSANFTILVHQSRRAVREHMRLRQERKALAKEAWINMLILGAMTLVIFKTVEGLADVSMSRVLFHTWPGKGCLLGIGFILFLFYRQVRAIDR